MQVKLYTHLLIFGFLKKSSKQRNSFSIAHNQKLNENTKFRKNETFEGDQILCQNIDY